MRDFLNKYGYYVLGVVIIVAGLLVWSNLMGARRPRPASDKAFYVDEETGEESVRPMTEHPPLPNANGKLTIVEASKFKWGKEGIKTLYLFKYSDRAKELLENSPEQASAYAMEIDRGKLYRSPEPGSPWYPVDTPEARALLYQKCADGSDPVRVVP